MTSKATRRFAAFAASVAWAALLLQLWLTVNVVLGQGRGFAMGLVVYFGFFTVLTNVLAAVCLSAFAAGPRVPGHRVLTHAAVITTVTAAITMVGLVYFFVLRHTWKPEGAQFAADAALHYAVPMLMLTFWLWVVPGGAVRRGIWPWLFVYPLVYLVYVFVRGEIFGIYPYFFIDVGQIGYGSALRNSLGVLVAYGAVVALLIGFKHVFARPPASR